MDMSVIMSAIKSSSENNARKDQYNLLNWLYVNIDLPKRVYEIHDMLNILDKIDLSINDQENHQKIMHIESMLKQTNEAIVETLKTIDNKKNKK
ncbi:MAG: hypothetical protein CXT73_07755 [Methanobacteriota archaeon]|nr:MAG: hypothetical protein CXT73_07755 [Euryarchaeota archaeon]